MSFSNKHYFLADMIARSLSSLAPQAILANAPLLHQRQQRVHLRFGGAPAGDEADAGAAVAGELLDLEGGVGGQALHDAVRQEGEDLVGGGVHQKGNP